MKRSLIFRYIIWGAIFGFLAGYFMTRLSEVYLYSNVFGGPYSGPNAITNYDKTHAHFVKVVINFAQFIILGVFLGLANGISNKSVSKTIYSVLGGVTAALLCFIYYAKKESLFGSNTIGTYAFIFIPRYLYFYAASIIIFCRLTKLKIDEMWISLFWSIIFTIPWMLVGIFAAISTFAISFSGYDPHNFFWRKSDIPYYVYYMIAGIFVIIGINVAEWKKKLNISD
ncbi:MAG: hypothetical protein V1490_04955 [Candidatus Omnitrophota bacterium]